MTDTITRVRMAVAESLGVELGKAQPDVTLESLGADSLDAVEIELEIEGACGVRFDDDRPAIVPAQTIQKVADLTDALLAAETPR